MADAAGHLSIVFDEVVTEADVFRLALDSNLRLSVHFVNGAMGLGCIEGPDNVTKAVFVFIISPPLGDKKWKVHVFIQGFDWIKTSLGKCKESARWDKSAILDQLAHWDASAFQDLWARCNDSARWNESALRHGGPRPTSRRMDGGSVLTFDDVTTPLSGVCDLAMIGNEKYHVEHEYQKLTGGPVVDVKGPDGVFVKISGGAAVSNSRG